jgi:hypothetical protein
MRKLYQMLQPPRSPEILSLISFFIYSSLAEHTASELDAIMIAKFRRYKPQTLLLDSGMIRPSDNMHVTTARKLEDAGVDSTNPAESEYQYVFCHSG